ncbi:Lactonohydrolase oryL, partial [Fulvia fulva]
QTSTGLTQSVIVRPTTTCLGAHDAILGSVPATHANINAVFVNQNFAVIPGEWKNHDIASAFYDIVPAEQCVSEALNKIKTADFIAFDGSFFDIIGMNAKIERIQSFLVDKQRVHEAHVYLPESNELLYPDTTEAGFMYAINIDSHELRRIDLNPKLGNINGGTYHRGDVYVATNGGHARGIYKVNVTSGRAEALVNNYRGRDLNSPNDLIFDSRSNLYFTDPSYGYDQGWPQVQSPELPNAIYRFDPRTKALTALSNSAVLMPNGLALSADKKTHYVADSSSSSLQPASQRAVFAFDIREGGLLDAPRLVYQVEGGWPDGLRVTESGLLIVGVYGGADIVDPKIGNLLGKINAPDDIIFNLEPARGSGVRLLTGKKHIYKVTMSESAVKPWVAGKPPFIHAIIESVAGVLGIGSQRQEL